MNQNLHHLHAGEDIIRQQVFEQQQADGKSLTAPHVVTWQEQLAGTPVN